MDNRETKRNENFTIFFIVNSSYLLKIDHTIVLRGEAIHISSVSILFTSVTPSR